MATKAKKKPADEELKDVAAELDRIRSEHDPEPDAVLTAILGWAAGVNLEIGRVRELAGKFRKEYPNHCGWRPGFDFLGDVLSELEGMEDAIRNLPSVKRRSIDVLEEEIDAMLPPADRGRKGGAA